MKEEVVHFGEPRRLAGLVTLPDGEDQRALPAVLLVNAGLIHKVGPHRLHVMAARKLAAKGYLVLRFDLSGVGDSPPRADNMPSDKSAPLEISEAVDFLAKRHGVKSVVSIGICSGAVQSFQAAAADERVRGAVLINAQARDLGGELDTFVSERHGAFYFWNVALFNPRSWWRALTGRIDYGAAFRHFIGTVGRLVRPRRQFTIEGWDIAGDLQRIASRRTPLLLVYSRGDPGVDLLDAVAGREVKELKRQGLVKVDVIADADHVFTPVASQERLIGSILAWLESAPIAVEAGAGHRGGPAA